MTVESPALIGFGLGLEATTLKSTTFTDCDWGNPTGPPFAPTSPETEMVVRFSVLSGVTSTSTEADDGQVVPWVQVVAVRVGKKQLMVVPIKAPHVPVPLRTVAVEVVPSPLGNSA